MAYNTPQRIAELSIEAGKRKVNLPLSTLLALGFFIRCLYRSGIFLLDIRVIGNVPKEWGSFAGFFWGRQFFSIRTHS